MVRGEWNERSFEEEARKWGCRPIGLQLATYYYFRGKGIFLNQNANDHLADLFYGAKTIRPQAPSVSITKAQWTQQKASNN